MRLQKSTFSSKWGLTQNDNVGVIQYDYKYMNDFNSFNRPEPNVTVSRPVFSKHTPLYIIALICVAGGTVAYWHFMNKVEVVPVVPMAVDTPMTESETETYRGTLSRISAEVESGNDAEEPIIISDKNAMQEVPSESVETIIMQNARSASFAPAPEATAVGLGTFTSATPEQSEVGGAGSAPETAYLEGDVTMLDFKIDNQNLNGTPVTLSGTVHANDPGMKRMVVVSGGVVYTLQTDSAKITTQTGKIIMPANLKNDDIVAVVGTKLDDSDVVIAQSITLTGVQDYVIAF